MYLYTWNSLLRGFFPEDAVLASALKLAVVVNILDAAALMLGAKIEAPFLLPLRAPSIVGDEFGTYINLFSVSLDNQIFLERD